MEFTTTTIMKSMKKRAVLYTTLYMQFWMKCQNVKLLKEEQKYYLFSSKKM